MLSEDYLDLVGAAVYHLNQSIDLEGWYLADRDFAVAEDTSAPSDAERVIIQLENQRTKGYMTISIDLRDAAESGGRRLMVSGIMREIKRVLQEARVIP